MSDAHLTIYRAVKLNRVNSNRYNYRPGLAQTQMVIPSPVSGTEIQQGAGDQGTGDMGQQPDARNSHSSAIADREYLGILKRISILCPFAHDVVTDTKQLSASVHHAERRREFRPGVVGRFQ
jgi:hypothetical protein